MRVVRFARFAIFAIMVLVLGLLAVGQLARLTSKPVPPLGALFEVDGRQMHLHCMGDGAGPVAIIEGGSEMVGDAYYWLQGALAETHRVCVYDRAGLGWSDPVPGEEGGVEADQAAMRLHALLEVSGEAGPYLIIGHSYGGFIATLLADRYPREVAGIVMLDASHPEEEGRLAAIGVPPVGMMEMRALRLAGRLGLTYLIDPLEPRPEQEELPVGHWEALSYAYRKGEIYSTMAAEAATFAESAMMAGEVESLGDLPLLVISAGYVEPYPGVAHEGYTGLLARLQDELAILSSASTRVTLPGAGHDSFAADPVVAQETAAVIRGWLQGL
jgi:pimeloyl-ACP methyl ester carboxylesterase